MCEPFVDMSANKREEIRNRHTYLGKKKIAVNVLHINRESTKHVKSFVSKIHNYCSIRERD